MTRDDNRPASINVFEHIDSICRQFRRHWKQGQRPTIEDYLKQVEPPARPTLFRNLLQIEIKYRQRDRETPAAEDYLNRFPELTHQIRQEFDGSSILSTDGFDAKSTNWADDELVTRTFSGPAANRLGDYELVRELGRGGFGVVYEARHLRRQNRVALKTLPTGVDGQEINAERLHKFRREFRSLAEINHPNLVGMQTLEVDGAQWFFTMDLIEGEDFLGYVRPNGQLDETRLRSAVKQLVQGIIFLHECGIVHRDLKPSNVLVNATGQVLILDFGLVARLQTPTDVTVSRSGMFAGTPRYAAPEQMFGERSEASDWYAFGTMLYESLTGQPPFVGGQMETLRKKQNENSQPLEGRAEYPQDLAQLVDGLLKREPAQRLSTSQILAALQLELETRTHGSTAGSHGSTGSIDEQELDPDAFPEQEVVLIGRAKQLAELEAAKVHFQQSREPTVVWITGKSGEGKSSLAERFLRPIRISNEMLVLSGRCYDRESVPFKAIDSIIEPLVVFLRSGHAQDIVSRLPAGTPYLAQLFPALRRVNAISKYNLQDRSGRLEPELLRAYAFSALRELLCMISRQTPLVLLIDDLQWGDADSAHVLMELMTGDSPSTILLLGSYRIDEASDSPFLQAWKKRAGNDQDIIKSSQVTVQPLTSAECIELAAARTGADRDWIQQHADTILKETGGNPYFLELLLRGLDEQSGPFQQVSLAEIVSFRLRNLPSKAEALLKLIAVSGQPIDVDELCHAAGGEQADLGTLTHMRSEQIVRLIGYGEHSLVDTYHDKVRESVLQGLNEPAKQNLHLRLAATIESREGLDANRLLQMLQASTLPGEYSEPISPRVCDLAHHFTEAKDPRAFVYQLLAGEQALQSYALEDALKSYNMARRLLPADAPAKLRYRMWIAMARVAGWNKDFGQSRLAAQQALDSASTPLDIGNAHAGLARAFRQVGRYGEAATHFDEALEQLGTGRSKNPLAQLFSFLTRSLVLFLVPSRWLIEKDETKRKLCIEAHKVFEVGAIFFEISLLAALDCFLRSAMTGLKTGEPRNIGLGYAYAAFVWSSLGIHPLSNLFLNRSFAVKLELADPKFRGTLMYIQGLSVYWTGDLSRSDSNLEEAIDELRRCFESYESTVSIHMRRHIAAYKGAAGDELEFARQVLSQSTEMNMFKLICWGNYDKASALARLGELPQAVESIQRANGALGQERFIMTEPIRASTDAYVRIQCSDYAAANERASLAWNLIKENWMFIDVSLLCLPFLVESRVGPNWAQESKSRDRQAIQRALRAASIFYRTLPNQQPHLLRVAGRALYAFGKKRKSIRKLERAVALAKRNGMEYQQARCLLDLAAIKEEDRDDNRSLAIELLKKMESVIPRAESWLLGEQYDEAVVAPEFDLKAWERENGPVSSQREELV